MEGEQTAQSGFQRFEGNSPYDVVKIAYFELFLYAAQCFRNCVYRDYKLKSSQGNDGFVPDQKLYAEFVSSLFSLYLIVSPKLNYFKEGNVSKFVALDGLRNYFQNPLSLEWGDAVNYYHVLCEFFEADGITRYERKKLPASIRIVNSMGRRT